MYTSFAEMKRAKIKQVLYAGRAYRTSDEYREYLVDRRMEKFDRWYLNYVLDTYMKISNENNELDDDLKAVVQYFGYSSSEKAKAKQVLDILSSEQIKHIKKKLKAA